MAPARILVVEDAEAIRLSVVASLTAAGWVARGLADGERLEAALADFAPDLVILDVMLPGRDGFTLLEVLRKRRTSAVIMLTARDATADRVRGLAVGADDYVVKPFAMAELVARVHAVLRRTRPGAAATVVGDLEIFEAADRVERLGRPIELTDTERRVLAYLASRRDQVVSKTQILTAVWGYEGFDENVVEVYVSALRRKLETDGAARVLHTVRGRGYRLAEQP